METSYKTTVKTYSIGQILTCIYEQIYNAFGPQNWWPGETPFEVIIGAILTQNTAWTNVQKAINNLKQQNLLEPERFKDIELERLAELIKPSGYYNQKAKKIKAFINFLFSNYDGNLNRLFENELYQLRHDLLQIKGIGPETADSIILYAGNKPIFVVDAYTHRFLLRHNLIEDKATYHQIQALFMDNLKNDVHLFNEFHALIVQLGKDICKKNPKCDVCPLKELTAIPPY